MSLLEKLYDTFLENTVETVGEQIKNKILIAVPYLFATAFVASCVLVIFRRLGR